MKNNFIICKLNYVRSCPQKIRLFSKIFKNKSIIEGLKYLNLLNNKKALILKKGLISALSNAKNNFNLNSSSLIIKEILVNNGPRLKRIMPRAKGKIDHIIKTTSNITFILWDKK